MRLPIVLTIALVASAFAPVEEVLKPADHATLGKSLQAWVKANADGKGISKAYEELAKEVEKLDKKAKRSTLSLTGDLGRVIWSSYDYSKGKVVKGKVSKETMPAYWDEKGKLEYAVWTPAKYDPKQSYPLLVCFPDAKQKPDQHLMEDWMDPALREKAVLVAIPLPEDEAAWNVAEAGATRPSGTGNLFSILNSLTRNHAVDFDKVFLCGRGASVGTALLLGSRFPDRFAGVIGRSGDAIAVVGENFRNLPTLFCGAGANATAFAESNEKLGYKNATLKADGTEADVWAWIGVQKRAANPTEVALWPGLPAPLRAYWIETSWDGQGSAWLKASCDRSTNTITITGEGVTKVTVYVNDVLLDLDKPVKVVCNGTESTGTIPRNLERTVGLVLKGRNDPGKVYVNFKQYDLPAPKKDETKAGGAGK
jgi:enterochelin esterase-like enzyme